MQKQALFFSTISMVTLAVSLATPSFAVDRIVPDQYTTIQDAIDDCSNGDVVIIAPNTYTGTGNRDIDFKGLAITVRSTGPNDPCVVAATIIDCNGSTSDRHRGFKFTSGEQPNSFLEGLTIVNAFSPLEEVNPEHYEARGGGMLCVNSSPTIRYCNLIGNNADFGGGLYCSAGQPVLIGCSISHNSADEGAGLYNINSNPILTDCAFSHNHGDGTTYNLGGGICNNNSNPVLSSCVFSDNVGTGAGVYNSHSNPCITDCSFVGNSSPYSGAGIYNVWSDPTVSNCTFLENIGDTTCDGGPGAGIYNYDSEPTIISCVFYGNSSQCGSGGAIYNDGGSTAKISVCLFIGNSVKEWGGAICEYESNTIISNCIFRGNNSANISGGAIYIYGSSPTIRNCTFFSNFAYNNGGGIYNRNSFSTNSNPAITNCILWSNIPEQIYVYSGSPVVTYCNAQGGFPGSGNIDADPCFTSPDTNDFHLKSQAGRWDPNSQSWVQDDVTSPCVDAGNPAHPIGLEPFPNGGIINMGAYGGTAEASKTYFGIPVCETIMAGDINGDCLVNFLDFALMAAHWLEDNT